MALSAGMWPSNFYVTPSLQHVRLARDSHVFAEATNQFAMQGGASEFRDRVSS